MIGYGSNFQPATLSPEQVGREEIINESDLNWLTTLLTTVGIAAAFIPGIGTAATVGIEAGLGAVQTALDYTTRDENPWYTAPLNFAGALIPLAGKGISNLRAASKLAANAEELSSKVGNAINKITDLEQSGVSVAGENFLAGIQGRGEALTSIAEKAGALRSPQRALGFFERNPAYLINDTGSILSKGNIYQGFEEIYGNFNEIFKDVKSLTFNALKKGATAVGETVDKSGRRIQRALTEELGISISTANKIIKAFRLGIKVGTKEFNELVAELLIKNPEAAALLLSKGKKYSNLAIKGTLRTRANQATRKAVKFGQETIEYLTNPSKIVSKFFEKSTGRLKSFLDGKAGELLKKVSRNTIKTEEALIEAFEKSGGQRVVSEWIMGYKVIEFDKLGATIMISFLPSATSGKTGRNVGGKHPIFVKATHLKLKQFLSASSKGQWYINNWAKNRGGRTASSSILGDNVAALLSFIPVEKINEVLGYASFYKSTFDSYRKGTLSFIGSKNYLANLGKVFVSGIISEAAKFASVGMKDGLAKSFIDSAAGSFTQGNGLQVGNSFSGALTSTYNQKVGQHGAGRGKSTADGLTSSRSGFNSLSGIK